MAFKAKMEACWFFRINLYKIIEGLREVQETARKKEGSLAGVGQGDGTISTKPPTLWEVLLDRGLENYSLGRIPE